MCVFGTKTITLPASRDCGRTRKRKWGGGLRRPQSPRALSIARLGGPYGPRSTKGAGRGPRGGEKRGGGAWGSPGRRLPVHLRKRPGLGPSGSASRPAPARTRRRGRETSSPARVRTQRPGLQGACARLSHPEPLFRRPPLPRLSRRKSSPRVLAGVSSGEVSRLGARWGGNVNGQRGDPEFRYGGRGGRRSGPASSQDSSEAGRCLPRGQLARAPQGALAATGRGGAPRAGPGPARGGTALPAAQPRSWGQEKATPAPLRRGVFPWGALTLEEGRTRRERPQRGDSSVGSRRAGTGWRVTRPREGEPVG